MATITITYTPAVVFKNDSATQQIFGLWNPATTASDSAVFEGTYYDTNKWDNGEFPYATSLEAFLAQQVAHPGLIAALRAAVRNYVPATETEPAKAGVYDWEATDADVLYIEELSGALADQGFEFATGSGS
jgi:methionine salvage enolase-phosphatase E1